MDPLIKIEKKLAAWLRDRVSERRYRHSLGVIEAVTSLALHYRLDPHPLRLAALLHDSLREMPAEELLKLARRWQLPIRDADMRAPVLLHGRVAAELAEREFGLCDPVMASAMKYHTAGHARMSLSDKLFFLADTIEEGRTQPAVGELRGLAYEDADRAMLAAIESSVLHLEAIGAVVDPETLRLKQSLVEKIGGDES